MTPRMLILTTSAALALSGCGGFGESRLNPFNWFGGGGGSASDGGTAMAVPARREDPRSPVAEITDIALERTTGGAILRVTGLAAQQGWYDAALVPATSEAAFDGTLDFVLRASPPPAPTRASTPWSREITVALFFTDGALAEVSAIRVAGARNVRTIRP